MLSPSQKVSEIQASIAAAGLHVSPAVGGSSPGSGPKGGRTKSDIIDDALRQVQLPPLRAQWYAVLEPYDRRGVFPVHEDSDEYSKLDCAAVTALRGFGADELGKLRATAFLQAYRRGDVDVRTPWVCESGEHSPRAPLPPPALHDVVRSPDTVRLEGTTPVSEVASTPATEALSESAAVVSTVELAPVRSWETIALLVSLLVLIVRSCGCWEAAAASPLSHCLLRQQLQSRRPACVAAYGVALHCSAVTPAIDWSARSGRAWVVPAHSCIGRLRGSFG